MTDQTRLREIQERVNAATREWDSTFMENMERAHGSSTWKKYDGLFHCDDCDTITDEGPCPVFTLVEIANAEHAAREDIPYLLSLLAEREARIDEVCAIIDRWAQRKGIRLDEEGGRECHHGEKLS